MAYSCLAGWLGFWRSLVAQKGPRTLTCLSNHPNTYGQLLVYTCVYFMHDHHHGRIVVADVIVGVVVNVGGSGVIHTDVKRNVTPCVERRQ